MKYAFVGLGSALLGLGIGISATRVFEIYHSGETDAPPVINPNSGASAPNVPQPIDFVVISIADASELYIGKKRVALAEIPGSLEKLLAASKPEERAVYIKGQPTISYETLSLVIRRVMDADVGRVEVIPNIKRANKYQ